LPGTSPGPFGWQSGARLIHHDPAGLERLRTDGWLIVQTAAAAAIAWLLAAAVLHHQQAGFAPIGAVIAVEVTRGQQVRHAIELVLGVTLGIGVACCSDR